MSLSRRQFFRRFWKTGDTPTAERLARYDVLETYARTQLLPYDFTLTYDQERELMADIRSALEQASHEALFSPEFRQRLEELVEDKVAPWRAQLDASAESERLREIRHAAPDYVAAFLAQATPATVDSLKETFGIEEPDQLEGLLKRQIEIWIDEADDRLVRPYDVVTVKDLVFAQLRAWC